MRLILGLEESRVPPEPVEFQGEVLERAIFC